MGQKVNPIGIRLGITRGWDSVWFAKKNEYGKLLIEDYKIREYIKKNIVNSDYHYDELGNVILNPNLGRKSKDDITVCDLTGTGVQDTAIARHTFNIALKKKLGIEV